MGKGFRWFFYLLLLAGLFTPAGRAQTISAASCSSTDVQAALNKVAADGTTVSIPAGTCTWTAPVNYNQIYSTTVIGQSTTSGTCAPGGTCSAVDRTIIVDSINRSSSDPALINVSTAAGKSFRLSGVTINWGGGAPTYNASMRITGKSQAIRFDHNHLHLIQAVAMRMGGWTYGVVDHNVFDAPTSGTWNGIKMDEVGWNNETAGNGDNSWADATTFGSNRFIFVENNLFDNPSNLGIGAANDCDHGGRYVWRYNLMNAVDLQTHPTGGAGRARGCRATEIYGNVVTGGSSRFNFMFLSSGTELIWSNNANNGNNGGGPVYQNFVTLHSDRRNNITYSQSATPGGWGYCGTSFTGQGSSWDENLVLTSGYHCLDDPGKGVGQLITGNFPNAINSTTKTIAWPKEAIEPVYEWLNVWTGTGGGSFFSNYNPDALIPNADYFLYTAAFTGVSGTGAGPLSARPSSCTAMVAYWATDTNTLYQCKAANTWNVYYQPYTYPHPLVSGQSAGNPTLVAPTNLSATVQ
jgi:hypothetical protein